MTKGARNETIRRLHQDGSPLSEIGKMYGISRQRVEQIVKPGQHRARRLAAGAIARGQLVKEACRDCGDPNSEAHHPDYDKPLDVEWLCFHCHRRQHRTAPRPRALKVSREHRVQIAADDLRKFVQVRGYVPNTAEFSRFMTGYHENAIPCLAFYIDPGLRYFGSTAVVMNVVYRSAGHPRS